MSKVLARRLRTLARNAEKIEKHAMQLPPQNRDPAVSYGIKQDAFTCNAVEKALGWEAKRRYSTAIIGYGEENDLWLNADFPSFRVLLLCFAAAMAETGDL